MLSLLLYLGSCRGLPCSFGDLTLSLLPLPCLSFRERRERELHEAYQSARSQEEAEGILQQYIERFTISEAVLERLEMPKILERSHSTEPNLSPFPHDPNPMKYLRQQSLPPPKFTATVETTVTRTSALDTSLSASSGSPSKTVTPRAVPVLTPKPYSQPRNSQEVLKTFKATTEGTELNRQEDENDGEKPEEENTGLASSGLFHNRLVLKKIMIPLKI